MTNAQKTIIARLNCQELKLYIHILIYIYSFSLKFEQLLEGEKRDFHNLQNHKG